MEDQELPPWLDATFLATALQGEKETAPQVSVTRFSATPAVAAGNNYTSQLYRVRVEFTMDKEEKWISLIVKAPFTNSLIEDTTGKGDFYDKEPKVYKDILPMFNMIVNWEFGPTSYYNCVNNALILLDLKEQGYKLGDRHKQLDFPHCKEVFKTLAKFHAASVVCEKAHPELIENVGKELLYNDNNEFKSTFMPRLESILKTVAGNIIELELSNVLEDLILSKVETIFDSLIKLCKPKTTGLNVLNHGDLSVNNILFKHACSGDIDELRFIDFQVVKYASPALDLLYFIWTSANEDVRESRLQELCEIYRLTLNSTLEELECEERLSAEELHEDIKDAVDWAILTVCVVLPFIVSDAEDVISLEELCPSEIKGEYDDKYLKPYNGRFFRSMLPKITSHFISWLDHYN